MGVFFEYFLFFFSVIHHRPDEIHPKYVLYYTNGVTTPDVLLQVKQFQKWFFLLSVFLICSLNVYRLRVSFFSEFWIFPILFFFLFYLFIELRWYWRIMKLPRTVIYRRIYQFLNKKKKFIYETESVFWLSARVWKRKAFIVKSAILGTITNRHIRNLNVCGIDKILSSLRVHP